MEVCMIPKKVCEDLNKDMIKELNKACKGRQINFYTTNRRSVQDIRWLIGQLNPSGYSINIINSKLTMFFPKGCAVSEERLLEFSKTRLFEFITVTSNEKNPPIITIEEESRETS